MTLPACPLHSLLCVVHPVLVSSFASPRLRDASSRLRGTSSRLCAPWPIPSLRPRALHTEIENILPSAFSTSDPHSPSPIRILQSDPHPPSQIHILQSLPHPPRPFSTSDPHLPVPELTLANRPPLPQVRIRRVGHQTYIEVYRDTASLSLQAIATAKGTPDYKRGYRRSFQRGDKVPLVVDAPPNLNNGAGAEPPKSVSQRALSASVVIEPGGADPRTSKGPKRI
ncbi:hypothetical protein BJ138DRAFT_1184373, partial [Hygrophoropsis aurantiaca]